MKGVLFFVCLGITISTYSQDRIETERPGEIQSPAILDKKAFQMEAGYQKWERVPYKSVTLPELAFRYGLIDWLELRLNVVNETQKWRESIIADGFHPLEPGIKIRLAQSADSSLTASFQGHIGLPFVSSGKHNPHQIYHKLRFLVQGELGNVCDMNVNFGTDWNYEDFYQEWFYGFSFDFELGNRWKTMAEFFGHSSDGDHSNELRVGLGYLLNNKLALDASAGTGLNDRSVDFMWGIGLSFRLK
jgi:hypothetical protein